MRRIHFNKMLRFLIVALLLLITVTDNAAVAMASQTDSAATFQNGKLVLIPQEAGVPKADLFQQYTKNMLPGDEKTFAVNLINNSSRNLLFFLWASNTDEQSDVLLSKINLKVEFLGNIIYQGPANGKGTGEANAKEMVGTDKSSGVQLGWVSANNTSKLTITVSVPSSLGNEYQGLIGSVDWTILCENYDEIIPPQIPSTPVSPSPSATPAAITSPTPTPTDDGNIDIDNGTTPGGGVSSDDDVSIDNGDIPQGTIVVDESDLGKLPQTGTLAGALGNSILLPSAVLIMFTAFSLLIYIRKKTKKNL